MSLLPPKLQDPLLKTLGPPIRKEQENKPVEVEVRPGIWRVNGKLETRFKLEEDQIPIPVVIEHDVDIPLPEWKPICSVPLDTHVKVMIHFQSGDITYSDCEFDEKLKALAIEQGGWWWHENS